MRLFWCFWESVIVVLIEGNVANGEIIEVKMMDLEMIQLE